METVKIEIDGKEVRGAPGTTILQAAQSAGIDIPTLCYHRDLPPAGSCRICVVELKNSDRLVGSCHTPIAEGMVVYTRSPKVISTRKMLLELLLAGHTGPCVNDRWAANCELHKISSDLEVGPPRFSVKRPRLYSVEEVSPYVRRDLSKCILCSRCITVCNRLAGQRILGTGYRGFRSKVVVDNDVPLNKDSCKDCYLCVEYCPTSALTKAKHPSDKQRGKKTETLSPVLIPHTRERANLLPMLKEAQENFRHIGRGFMVRTARLLSLSLSDVYGVATFYSFLSTKRQGKNVIRVCKSVPCYLRNSEMILKTIEDEIGIKPGEVTADKRFSLHLVNCIGACDQAPAMLVNHDVHGRLTPKKISKILRQY